MFEALYAQDQSKNSPNKIKNAMNRTKHDTLMSGMADKSSKTIRGLGIGTMDDKTRPNFLKGSTVGSYLKSRSEVMDDRSPTLVARSQSVKYVGRSKLVINIERSHTCSLRITLSKLPSKKRVHPWNLTAPDADTGALQ